MSNEHPDMHGNPMDAPFLCHQCEKEVREDRAYGSDAAPSEMFCSLECVNEWQESQIATLTAERDEARKGLAELRKAPGMEEVDAELAYYHTNYHTGVSLQCVTKLANIARRSIAAMQYSMKNFMEMMNEQTRTINLIDNKFWEEKRKADEVVGLLKYLFRNQEFRNSFDWAILSEEARRILEIVEGK